MDPSTPQTVERKSSETPAESPRRKQRVEALIKKQRDTLKIVRYIQQHYLPPERGPFANFWKFM